MSAASVSAPPSFEITVHVGGTDGLDVATGATAGTRATLHLHGEMDLSNAELLPAVLASQLRLGRRFIRLDVSELAFLDSAGVRAIVEGHQRCLAVRATLVVTGVTPRIARLLAPHLDGALLVAGGPGGPPHRRAERLAAGAALRP